MNKRNDAYDGEQGLMEYTSQEDIHLTVSWLLKNP